MTGRPAARPSDAAATPDRPAARTRSQLAYEGIRRDIIAGELPAGEPLRLEALKERYGLSYSPIREALQRLQAERLVTLSALRGFRVSEISIEKMWDSIETRILIECEGLRRSVRDGSDAWEVEILGAYHAFVRQAERMTHDGPGATPAQEEELEQRHWRFHAALYSAAGSEWIRLFCEQLYAQTERYRRPLLPGGGASALGNRDTMAEHRRLMDTVLARDAEAAMAELAAHYRRTGEVIERWISGSGDDPPEQRRASGEAPS